MDVILHLGAHRTASTSFQQYMTQSAPRATAFWGPSVTRGGLFDGVHGSPIGMRPMVRAKGRIAVQLARAQGLGAERLVISDENMIGPLRSNLRCATLYPEIGLRMARYRAAFGPRITRVVLQIRALDSYWSSVLAFGLTRCMVDPDADLCARLAASTRGWRDVITDLACAMPDVPIMVTSFERMAQRPDLLAARMTGQDMPPLARHGVWANRRLDARRLQDCVRDLKALDQFWPFDSDGQWQPFSPVQRYALRARTATCLDWLRAGADGLAAYCEYPTQAPTVRAGPVTRPTRGSEDNDSQERRMARPC